MNTLAATELPEPSIRLVVDGVRDVTGSLELLESAVVTWSGQPLVKEQVGRRHDHAAVHVVLPLQVSVVTAAHGGLTAVALEVLLNVLGQRALEVDPVHRLYVCTGRQSVDVAEELLHALGSAQPIQRPNDKGCIPQPAVAIVPVATAVGCFGDRGCQRSDDRTGSFVLTQLKGDRGTDNGVLPLKRDRQRACPRLPVMNGAVVRLTR